MNEKSDVRVLLGIYLVGDTRPRFRSLCDDWDSAREYVELWMAKGFVDITAEEATVQDHYSPHQIQKVRFRAIRRVVTGVVPTDQPWRKGEMDEVSHYEDDNGKKVDPWTMDI